MKFVLGLLLLLAGSAWAEKHAECEVVRGIFPNSSMPLHNLRFETLVDVFSVTNARAMTLEFNGDPMRFLRSDIDVDRQTKLIYLLKKKNKTVRAARVLLDRTPRAALRSREFYGLLHLSEELENGEVTGIPQTYTYNFYCRF